MKNFKTPDENRAYMDGFIKGRQKDDLEWWQVRMAVEAAKDLYTKTVAKKDAEIERLKEEKKRQRDEYERRIIDLESQIEAHKIAWRHRNEA